MLKEIEARLVGMAPGEEKTVQVDFPAEWRVAEFAGKPVRSPASARSLRAGAAGSRCAFIRSFGVKSGEPEQFRAEIRSNLERELKGALMQRLRKEVGEQLAPSTRRRNAAAPGRERSPRAGANRRRAGPPPGPAGRRRPRRQFMDAARKRVLVALLVGEIARRNELSWTSAAERDHAPDRIDLRRAGAGH
jgi:trigger factor